MVWVRGESSDHFFAEILVAFGTGNLDFFIGRDHFLELLLASVTKEGFLLESVCMGVLS